MAAAIPFIMLAGMAVQVTGQIKQGEAAAQAADEEARIQSENAKLARDQAAHEERQQRIINRKQLGSMRAAYGASGVSLEGSPLDILEESAAAMEMDAQNIKYAGELKARGFYQEASMARTRGKNAREASYLGAASSLLSGAGQMAGYSKGPTRTA